MKRRRHILGILLLATGIIAIALVPQMADAQRVFPSIVPNCDQDLDNEQGYHTISPENRCNFNHFMQLMINLFDWGLAILSILSVTFFIIGGTMLLVSGGQETRIQQGKGILANTALGLMVAMGSWLVINTVIGLLVGNGTFQDVQVFGKNWWGVPTCTSEYNQTCTQGDLHIKCGDISSTYVSDLQRALNRANGCLQVEVDGCFGPATETAVRRFNQAQAPQITPANVASNDTWNALNEGKGCIENVNAQTPATAVPPQIPGCCVPACQTGFPNTVETNGSDGCKEIFTQNVTWYDVSGGSCPAETQMLTGCCVTLDGRCFNTSNRFWCTANVAEGGGGGAYHNNVACSASICGGAPIQQCSN